MNHGLIATALVAMLAGCGPIGPASRGIDATIQAPAKASTLAPAPSFTTAGAPPASSSAPFALNLTPLPSETALPTLVLPTLAAFISDIEFWDSLPTYPAESRPDYDFRLKYDPTAWALTTDQFGNQALARRSSADCIIAPAAGRGLPLSATVDHAVRQIGSINFQIDTAIVGGEPQFVNYTGGDGAIYTAFTVSFTSGADQCLTAAEAVLGTLRSVPASEATPLSTP
jgi:hypothetical protein